MDSGRWAAFERFIRQFGIQPILAIVPDNRDPGLAIENEAPDFWERMRSLEAVGATIALHGYRHLCASRGRSLLPLHKLSEFAGISAETQREWIRSGLEILRSHRLNPKLWVAPRHGFDRNTLKALQAEGIFHISDGFARVPVVRAGMTWIPQQLWAPVAKSSGVWTICIHTNNTSDEDVEVLHEFLQEHRRQFTSFDLVVAQCELRPLNLRERFYEMVTFWRFILSHRIKRDLRGG
jgi:hypothetical protein